MTSTTQPTEASIKRNLTERSGLQDYDWDGMRANIFLPHRSNPSGRHISLQSANGGTMITIVDAMGAVVVRLEI